MGRKTPKTPPIQQKPAKRQKKRFDWKDEFLAAVSEYGTVLDGCRAVGISRSAAYAARQTDAAFAAAWDEVEQDVDDALWRTVIDRAINGVPITTECDGKTTVVRRPDTKLLMFAVEARRRGRAQRDEAAAAIHHKPITVEIVEHDGSRPETPARSDADEDAPGDVDAEGVD